MEIIVVVAITGAGLVTGLLFAFSTCVIRALADLPNDKGMFAMQRINQVIVNPVFLALFLGTPLLCALIAVRSFLQISGPGNLLLFSGALAYLIGPFGITVLFNVPLNDQLAKAAPALADEAWPAYRTRWLRWNHLRTAIGAASIALLAAGLGAADSY